MRSKDKCCNQKENHNCDSSEKTEFQLKLHNMIENIATQEGYESYDIFERHFSTQGGNYLGVISEIDIKGKTVDGDKENNLFVKQAVKNDHQSTFSIEELYKKECLAYKELSNIFQELQDEAGIAIADRYLFPKCYKANSNFIVLENLMKRDFKTYSRFDVVSLSFAELAIKELAKLHGLFYVLQKKRSTFFNEHLRIFKQPFIMNEEFKVFAENVCKTAIEQIDDKSKEKVEKFLPVISDIYFKATTYTSVGSTICHGDYKINNIMVKEVGGEPTQIVPVDYQLMCYGSPLNDFMFFIYTTTDKKFRSEHLQDLKNLYHNSLANFLNYFNLDVEDIFSRKEFESQFKERLDYLLIICLIIMPILLTAEDHVPDLETEKMSDMSFMVDPRCSGRIQDVIDELVEWGYL